MNKNGPRRLLYLNVQSPEQWDSMKRLAGLGGVALLDGVCYWPWALGFQKPTLGLEFFLNLLLVDQKVKL